MASHAIHPTDRTILQALSRAATLGVPCPRNDDLAELIDASSVSTVSYALRRLERHGFIKVERFHQGREVTIAATGKRTAPYSGNRQPHWREAAGQKTPVEPPIERTKKLELQSALPDRPCFRCGSRGWCGHDGRTLA